jgi:3-hydroxyacyl-CoA dehydrogenase
MPLVEVIRGAKSSDATIARVFALARRLDKTPIIVNDGPGFLVNRILSPYLNEAGWLLADGATVEAIDGALLDFGMPMGPLRLLDEVGLDVSRHAGAVLHEAFGERMAPAPTLLALQDSGLLGRKGGRGFYAYEGDTAKGVNDSIHDLLGETVPTPHRELAPALIVDRAVLSMVNEAARVLEDGIVDGPGEVDLGMITGTGFPPFRGGLLRWADALGLPVVLKRLETFERDYGARFEPAQSIRERAAALRGFYD